jgi:hypothetical protein
LLFKDLLIKNVITECGRFEEAHIISRMLSEENMSKCFEGNVIFLNAQICMGSMK